MKRPHLASLGEAVIGEHEPDQHDTAAVASRRPGTTCRGRRLFDLPSFFLINLPEIAVPAQAVAEAGGTGYLAARAV